jgi:predicted NBD/HSP70 family sugar kinase
VAAGRQDDRTFARRGLLRFGVDVGGTNTDAVLMDGLTVHGEVKTPTTDG